jgi:TPR repeat protein
MAAALLLALGTCAPASRAQSNDTGDSPEAVSLRDVAAVKASGGIAPQVFAKLEGFRPAAPPRLQGALHRVVLRRAITRDGKDAGTDHRVIEFLPGAPGYQFEAATSPDNSSAFLTYGPFLTVASHTTKHLKQTFPHLDIDSVSTTRITDASLPASLDDALTPGKVWQTAIATETAVTSKNAVKSIDRSNTVVSRRNCATSERKPASVVSPALAGAAVFVACQPPDKPDEGSSFVYLEDYGVFFPVDYAFKLAPQGTRVTNVYTVERVDVDTAPADVAPARTTTAALPTLAETVAAYKRHDDATAFADATALANAGDTHGQMLLSRMLHEGRGAPADEALAAKWALRSAEQGYDVAQVDMGLRYEQGLGVAADNQAAFGWYMKAAQQGNADGQSQLGICYTRGSCATKDPAAALQWFGKAAAQGQPDAMANLGILYAGESGLPADFDKSALWTRRAADRGSVAGQDEMCVLYGRGYGVPKDIEQADFWCVLASNGGSAHAKDNRTRLESLMSPAQKARVLARALAWQPVDASKAP